MNLNRRIKIVGVVFIATLLLAFSDPGEKFFEISKNLDIFASVFKEVNAHYVDDVNPNKLIKTGIDAMLQSLDPYTNYIPEDLVEDFRTQNTGQYGGIGAMTQDYENRTFVSMILEGFPAEKGGLKIGDEVIAIDGVDLTVLTREEANQLMKGQIGTPVELKVIRYGESNPVTLNFTRAKIKVSNVPFSGIISNNVGMVKLTDFTPDAGKEVKAAIVGLIEQGAKGIVLDLRDNPGGLLMEAVNVTNVFIPKGKEVVSTRGKISENNASYKTLNTPVDTEIPVVVLINSGSASASEIVAGTLQDYDRAVVVGQRSFGKGLVQVPRPLSYNSQLKVTTAKYYTASGRCIQALDYSHRREDGSVGYVPDSLKTAFKTKNGRIVYDGGGVEPDVPLPARTVADVTLALFQQRLFFDYATQYFYQHESIAPAREFQLSDQEYLDFVKWAKSKRYTYESELEEQLSSLEAYAKTETYYNNLEKEFAKLKQFINNYKENDLLIHKNEIKVILEDEIAARYYLERGSVESNIKYDTEAMEAIRLINDKTRYQQILAGK
ncbi:MAG TPA: S41 family peptidase [Cyclobacteriaceae bacterium]|nr:S41 family peptidase [Cyclobacteriaceae bacterium]